MERLTLVGYSGICQMASTEYCRKHRDCYECGHGRLVFKRLSAYEDTGLEPEEITANMEMFAAYRHVCGGLPPERVAELVKATEEGRLVILPPSAKEGDPKPECFEDYGGSLWCLGYQRSEDDDEPCERCKKCWYCEDGDYADDGPRAALDGGGE